MGDATATLCHPRGDQIEDSEPVRAEPITRILPNREPLVPTPARLGSSSVTGSQVVAKRATAEIVRAYRTQPQRHRTLTADLLTLDPMPWRKLLVRVGGWSVALVVATSSPACETVVGLAP